MLKQQKGANVELPAEGDCSIEELTELQLAVVGGGGGEVVFG